MCVPSKENGQITKISKLYIFLIIYTFRTIELLNKSLFHFHYYFVALT